MQPIMEPVKEQFQGPTLKCHLSEIMREKEGVREGVRKERRKDSKMMNHTPMSLGVGTGVLLKGNHAKTQ